MPAILPISLSIHSLKHLCKVFTFTKFSLAAGLLPDILKVNSWLTVPSLTVAFSCLSFMVRPIRMSRSKSSNWLKKPFLWLSFFVSRNHICFNRSVVSEITISTVNQQSNRNLNVWQLLHKLSALIKNWQFKWGIWTKISLECLRFWFWTAVS